MNENNSLNKKTTKNMESKYMNKLSLEDLDKMYKELKKVSLVDSSTDTIEKSFFFRFVDRLLKIAKDNQASLYSANSIINEYIEERNNVVDFLKSIIFDDKMPDVSYQEQRKLAVKIFRILEGGTADLKYNFEDYE